MNRVITPYRLEAPAPNSRAAFLPPAPVLDVEVDLGGVDRFGLRAYAGEIVRVSGASRLQRRLLLVGALGRAARNATVASVFSEDALPGAASVAASVALPMVSRGLDVSEALARAQLELDMLGAAELAQRRPETLNPAEIRIALLARALAARPALLVLEQAEELLGPLSVSALRLALWSLSSGHDSCVLMTTEHPRLIASADRHIDLDRRLRPLPALQG